MKFCTLEYKNDHKNLNKAIKVSELSSCNQKHGAVIVKNGKTVAVGVNVDVNFNRIVTDPKTQASIHAEVAALNSAKKMDLTGATIYVARTNRTGKPLMSKPCPRCQEAIKEAGIKKVYYTIDNYMEL